MPENDRGAVREIETALEDDSDEWLRPPTYRYLIVGYQYDGEFSLGFQLHDSSPAHPDVVPEHVYRTVLQRITGDLDMEHIRSETTDETPTVLGVCTIEDDADGELQATIELDEAATTE